MATYEVDQLNITKDGNTYRFKGGSGNGILYGTSNTAADVQAKTVTIEGISEYTEGLSVRIKFVNGQTYNGAPTLNINSLGAKNVQTVSGTLGMQYMWRAGEVVDFIYDGTAFIEVNGGISTTDYYGVTKLSNAVDSNSQYVAATPYAVKQAYDKATELMQGATASAAGAAGNAPAPAAGDQLKMLAGDGTWKDAPSARVTTVTGTITNASGSYSGTFQNNEVVADMKVVEYVLGDPAIFGGPITITPGAGSVTVTCPDVAGTSTISIELIKTTADPSTVTSSEFDILNNRIGKDLTAQTLAAGGTTLTFQDSAITTNSTIIPYASIYGVAPTNIVVTTGQAVLTFAPQESAMSVYLRVW